MIYCALNDNTQVMWISNEFCGLLFAKYLTSYNYLNFKVFFILIFSPFINFYAQLKREFITDKIN